MSYEVICFFSIKKWYCSHKYSDKRTEVDTHVVYRPIVEQQPRKFSTTQVRQKVKISQKVLRGLLSDWHCRLCDNNDDDELVRIKLVMFHYASIGTREEMWEISRLFTWFVSSQWVHGPMMSVWNWQWLCDHVSARMTVNQLTCSDVCYALLVCLYVAAAAAAVAGWQTTLIRHVIKNLPSPATDLESQQGTTTASSSIIVSNRFHSFIFVY